MCHVSVYLEYIRTYVRVFMCACVSFSVFCRKCNVNWKDGKYTALHLAVKFFKPKNVEMLVQHGAGENPARDLTT